MELMSQRDSHGVDVIVLQQLGVRRIPLGDIVLLHAFTSLLLQKVGDSDDLYIVKRRYGVAVGIPYSAQTNDTNS